MERIREYKVNLKALILIVILTATVSFGTAGYVFSQSSSQTITIESPSFTETASYVIENRSSTIYAKNGTTGEIECIGTDAKTVIQQAINSLSYGKIVIRQGEYLINQPLVLKSRITLYLEAGAVLKASSDMERLIDGRDVNNVAICGDGIIDGNGLVTKVVDLSQSNGIVTHNRVERVTIKNAKAVTDSCLLDITLNSGFQLEEPMLDGGGTTQYGIIQNDSYGQNTLYLGDYNNGFTVANIVIGGGAITIIGGALEGTSTNILITSENGNPRVKVFGTWMESEKDNILIQDNPTYKPLVLDVEPVHMYTAGAGGYANIRSTTTSGHHLVNLYISGGYWENAGGTYHLDVNCEQAVIAKSYFTLGIAGINTDKIVEGIIMEGDLDIKGLGSVDINALDGLDLYLTVDTDKGVYLKDRGNNEIMVYFTKNGIVLNGHYIIDPANANATSTGNLVKVIKVFIDGKEYYIPVYDSFTP